MTVAFHVSDTRIEILGLPPEAERGLSAVWRWATPVLPPLYDVRFEVSSDAAGYTLCTDGEVRASGVPVEDLLATVEGVLYRDIEAWTPPRRVLLHAGTAHLDGRTFVLVGPSGAGKSSVTYALLARGARYLTDELTLFDGERIWGVSRTPQLDPVPVGQGLPDGFPPADLTSYVFRSVDGPRALPLLPIQEAQVATEPLDARSVQLVFPRRAEHTEVVRLPAAEALRRLHDEVRGALARDLGPLLRRTAVELTWKTPAEGAAALCALDL